MAAMADVSTSALSEEMIFKAIHDIRYLKKKRPDPDLLFKYISNSTEITVEEFNSLFESLVNSGTLCVRVNSKGKQSLFVNEDLYEESLANIVTTLYSDSPQTDADELQVSQEQIIDTGDKREDSLNDNSNINYEIVENIWGEIEKRVSRFFMEERLERKELLDELKLMREENNKLKTEISKTARLHTEANDYKFSTKSTRTTENIIVANDNRKIPSTNPSSEKIKEQLN